MDETGSQPPPIHTNNGTELEPTTQNQSPASEPQSTTLKNGEPMQMEITDGTTIDQNTEDHQDSLSEAPEDSDQEDAEVSDLISGNLSRSTRWSTLQMVQTPKTRTPRQLRLDTEKQERAIARQVSLLSLCALVSQLLVFLSSSSTFVCRFHRTNRLHARLETRILTRVERRWMRER